MSTDGQKWVVDGLIAEGDINLIIGKPHRCKSWMAQGISVSVGTGTPCLGRFSVEQSPVIFIDEDTPTTTLEWRFRRLCGPTGTPLVSASIFLRSMQGFQVNDSSDMRELINRIEAFGEHVLVVLDCLDAVCPTLNTNRTEAAKLIQSKLREITAAGATLLVVHHLSLKDAEDLERWESDKDFTRTAMGNTKLVALSDTIFGVWRLSERPLIFGIKKRERRTILDVPERFTVRLEEDADRTWALLTYDEEIGTLPTENARITALLFVLNPGESYKVKDIYERSGQILGMPDLRQALRELERNGVVQKGRLPHNLYTYRLAPDFGNLESQYADAIRGFRTKTIHTEQ